MTIFEFVPAASRVVESQDTRCFFTMSSSNRWTKTSAAESRAKAESSTRGQEYRDSQYDNEARRSVPSDEYALRRSVVIPDNKGTTPGTLFSEDHMAFCNGYRVQKSDTVVSGSR